MSCNLATKEGMPDNTHEHGLQSQNHGFQALLRKEDRDGSQEYESFRIEKPWCLGYCVYCCEETLATPTRENISLGSGL